MFETLNRQLFFTIILW